MVEGVGTGSGWEPWPSAVAVRSQRTAYLLLQAAFGSIPVMTQLMTEAAWENEVAKCSALTEVCSCLVKKKVKVARICYQHILNQVALTSH